MARNKALIEMYKRNKKMIENVTPSIYAAIALALNEINGFGYDEISAIFIRSQEIWLEHIDDERSMIEKCSEEIGIDIVAGVNERRDKE